MPARDERRTPIAVIGAGWVGTNRHLPALVANKEFHVVGIVDRHASRSAGAAKRHRLLRHAQAECLDDVPWIEDVRAITIATAPESHGRLLAEARGRGLDVLTEKPFTLRMEDAEAAAAPSEAVVAVMHNFQFARSARRLWADVESGSLGDIRAAEAVQWSSSSRRLPDWYEQLPLGLFFDESPHLLYLLRRLAPSLKLENAHVVPSYEGRATPSVVSAHYSTTGTVPIPLTLSLNFRASVSEWYFAVHGSDGVGVVDLFRDIYVRIPPDHAHGTRDVLRTSLAGTVGHWRGFVSSGYRHVRGRLWYGVDEVMDRFARAIARREDPAGCGRLDALAVRKLQEQIIVAAEPDD